MVKVLFVCLGNICRSPLAEGLFGHKVSHRQLTDKIFVDSAGTDSYHIGELPDSRMRAVAADHGIILDSSARKFHADDLVSFDYILAMDRHNLRDIENIALRVDNCRARVQLMRAFDPEPDTGDVPDPYYGGVHGFHEVYAIVDRCTDRLLEELSRDHGL